MNVWKYIRKVYYIFVRESQVIIPVVITIMKGIQKPRVSISTDN